MTEIKKEFRQQVYELFGAKEGDELLASLEQEAPTSIRLNKEKAAQTEEFLPQTRDEVPWCPRGYYLSERPRFTADPLFHAGAYYVQEASSMLIHQIQSLLGEEPMLALDLCAAPGGKSTLLHDLLPKGSLIVSNEVVPNRANILLENILKWGNPYNIVCSSMPNKWSKVRASFDLILVDAPCSGEGMFRKEAIAREEWQADSPQNCAIRQQGILEDIAPCLKENGFLVYSTCTLNRQENEEIVSYLVEELGFEAIDLSEMPELIPKSTFSPYPAYRMMPHKVEGEGLFMAVLRKANPEAPAKTSKKKSAKKSTKQAIPSEVKVWVKNPDRYSWVEEADQIIYAYPQIVEQQLDLLRANKIAVFSAGLPVATTKGKSYIPHQALALSQARQQGAFQEVELDWTEAIKFLAKQNISLDEHLDKGFKLITYKGLGLGFIKHLGNRANNLYPNEWRIRQWEAILKSSQE